MMMNRNGIHELRNNGLNQKNWEENRDFFIEQHYPEGSTFLNLEKLKKTGHSLETDAGYSKDKTLPRKFLNIGKID